MKRIWSNEKAESDFPKGLSPLLVLAAVVVVGILIAGFLALPVINGGHEGVVYDNGKGFLLKPLPEGMNQILPFWQHVTEIDIRSQIKEVDADAASKDLQIVTSKIALSYHPTKGETPLLMQQVGPDFVTVKIAPAIQEAVKQTTAKFTAEELITKREEVSFEIKNTLREKLAPVHITVDEFSILNFAFSPKFTEAIEAKQEAEQFALKAKNDLLRIQIEKEQTITRAQATAEAIRIESEAINKAGGDNYVKLKSIEKWDGKYPFMVMQGSGSMTPLVQIPMPATS